MGKKIAIIGSSGGNLFSMGGKDPKGLLGEMVLQIGAAGMEVTQILFVGAQASMDFAKPDTKAQLWGYEDGAPTANFTGSQEEVNERAKAADELLAKAIEDGSVDALILVSADPKNVHAKSIDAAVKAKIAATGTGGTSMADAQAKGLNVVAVSGTTGTTNRTRAIAAVMALAKHFGVKYRPIIGNAGSVEASGSVFSRISLRGILMGSLPGFIAMAITLLISQIPGLPESATKLFDVVIACLPVLVAVVAARQVSGLNEVAIVAGVIAGTLSVSGGLIGGIAKDLKIG